MIGIGYRRHGSRFFPGTLAALQAKFVYCDEIADLISAAFYEPCNLLLWGPGGHGKSEMVLTAIKALGSEGRRNLRPVVWRGDE